MMQALPSGLTGLLIDAEEFLSALRFARPGLLWLLLVLPVLGLLNRFAAHRRRQALQAIGQPFAIANLVVHPHVSRRWLGLAYPLAWIVLVLGVAGPRWGKSDDPGVAVGRDLVLVVDLSRSMTAEDMNDRDARARWQAEKRGLRNLMDTVEARGGHRIAIVLFAGRPKIACPLTTDYEHVRAVIEEIDGAHPPPECRMPVRSDAISGTRIGAALTAAVGLHDARFPGSQDIILISDGDDPGDDQEWKDGITAALEAGIPVHTVGLGDPMQPIPITIGDPENLDFVGTKLMEAPLEQIARDTRGEYVPARREEPMLGNFFRTRIEPFASREVSDEAIPQPRERYPWFLAPALALFAIGWFRGR